MDRWFASGISLLVTVPSSYAYGRSGPPLEVLALKCPLLVGE